MCNLQLSTIRLCRKAVKDEIKPLEAPAVTYINTSMAVQMLDCFTCKGERDKESRNRQKKEALVRLLVEKSENQSTASLLRAGRAPRAKPERDQSQAQRAL